MSSLYKQTKSSENHSKQSQPRRSIYLNSNRNANNENNQSSISNNNENSSIQEQKTFRYIRYLKDQNVQLKQQLDKERQVSPLRGGFEMPMSRINDQFNQMQVHQFQIQLAALQNEFMRYKTQNEDQFKERLDQIENLLKEKQNFLTEKEKLTKKNKALSEQVRELKLITDNLSPEERSSQLKTENEKLKEEHDRIRRQVDEVRSQRNKVINENEKLARELIQLKNENKKLKTPNQDNSNQDEQPEQQFSSTTKRLQTRTTERKPRSKSTLPKEGTKSQKRYAIDNKQERGSTNQDDLDTADVKTRDIDEVQQIDNSVNKDHIIDLQTQIKVLSHQLREKMDAIDKLRSLHSEEKKNYDKLMTENTELTDKCNKYIDETNLCNATIIRQKNNLDDKDKEINALQLKTSKIKKLLRVVSNIKNTNIILNERNKELEQKLFEITNPNSNLIPNHSIKVQDISFSKIDSLVEDLK